MKRILKFLVTTQVQGSKVPGSGLTNIKNASIRSIDKGESGLIMVDLKSSIILLISERGLTIKVFNREP